MHYIQVDETLVFTVYNYQDDEEGGTLKIFIAPKDGSMSECPHGNKITDHEDCNTQRRSVCSCCGLVLNGGTYDPDPSLEESKDFEPADEDLPCPACLSEEGESRTLRIVYCFDACGVCAKDVYKSVFERVHNLVFGTIHFSHLASGKKESEDEE